MMAAGLAALVGAGVIVAFETLGNPFATEPEASTLQPLPTVSPAEAPIVLPGTDQLGTPSPSALSAVLDRALATDDLGARVGAAVADLSTGELLYNRDADVPMTPASTLKLLTSAAALEALGPGHRFHTHVVSGTDADEIVLLGGGDPMLATADPLPAGSTSLAELAERTAAVLTEGGTTTVRLGFDESLFSGPAVNPDWRPTYVPNGVVAPVSALAVDGGREEPGLARRAADPGQATAVAFADLLEVHGITVDGSPYRTDAATGLVPLATVESVPLADIVEHLIASSDNDVAEVVFRQVAIARGSPGRSEAASAAVSDVLAGLGLDTSGLTVLDGSGLARGNAVPAILLVQVLVLAGDPAQPDLRPVLTGLPVAAFNGTLSERVEAAPGVVRAKTGTLTGVHSLAGTVAADDGTVYAFAVLADEADDTEAARAALDTAAVELAECGCATPPGGSG